MKVNSKFNINNNLHHSIKPQTFTGKTLKDFKTLKKNADALKDIVSIQNLGLNSIKNVRSGEYGTICKGSIPLRNFNDYINKEQLFNLYKKGISTNRNGYARSFLKTSADNPVSTSYVHDCSVMYLHNKDTNTHTLYHTLWNTQKKHFKFLINNLMPEGVTNAGLAPGCKYWTTRHEWTLQNMFNAIKEVNNDTIVNVYHNNSPYPEIVGHKGKLFEIPNRGVLVQKCIEPRDYGQASFSISDIQEIHTIDRIEQDWTTKDDLTKLKNEFIQSDYDIEIKKVLSNLIDRYVEALEKIEHCETKADLINLKITQGIDFIKQFYDKINERLTKLFI